MAKVKPKRRRKQRTLSEKVWIVVAVLICIAMVLATVSALFMGY